jgi:hypothetical protein
MINFKTTYKFLKEALSESNGTGSFSRVASAVIITSTIVWISFLVFTTHTMPDLAGPTLFMASGSGVTYGTNKLSSALGGKDKDAPTA